MSIKLSFTRPALEKSCIGTFQDVRDPYLHITIRDSGTKTFFYYRSWNSKPMRITIGRFPSILPDVARKVCQQYSASLAMGIDPREEKRKAKAQATADEYSLLTVADVLEVYLERKLSDATKLNYRNSLKNGLHELADLPMASLDVAQVKGAMQGLEKDSIRNSAITLLIALFNFGNLNYRPQGRVIFPDNVAAVASKLYSLKTALGRRTRRLNREQLAPWWEHTSMMEVKFRVFYHTLLLTGCRRGEWSLLEWSDVDLDAERIVISKSKTKSKNRASAPDHFIPLTDAIRCELELLQGDRTGLVFPNMINPNGGNRATPVMMFGVSCHDLRRTYTSISAELNVNPIITKKLLHHASGDVTEGYVIFSDADLRAAIDRIDEFIMSCVEGGSNVIDFPSAG